MKYAALLTGSLLISLSVGAAFAPAENDDKEKAFMRAKLAFSQEVLQGLALEDFRAIAKNAEQLKLLSLDANWQVMQTAQYTQHSADFRRTTESLITAAEDKNVDRALLAYFQMTQSCVTCHKYVRDVRK